MRYLSLLICCWVLLACNNRSSVTAETREPVYYDEAAAVEVPQPQTEMAEPALDPQPTQRSRNAGPLQPSTRGNLPVRRAETLDLGERRRSAPPSTTPPARVNREALPTTTAPARRTTPAAPAPAAPEVIVAETMPPPPPPPAPAATSTAYPTHDAFDALLRRYVDARGRVDYAGLKANRSALDAYLTQLGADAPTANWPDAETMAYWINAYNAYTLRLIVDNYPTNSIKDLKGGKPWDVKWIDLGGKTYSLNNIEHDILRARFDDARIHAAVNCAAASCPPLWNRAFTGANLNKALEQRTKSWINDPAYNKLAPGSVQLSKLFDWYGDDFGNKVAFLNRYTDGPRVMGTARIDYLDYNWALNEQ